jgi:hypothetical protein
MPASTELLALHVEEQHFPRYDDAHGTPDPMVRRLLTVTLARGAARFEQTDYGHPGRWNAWDPRGIDAAIQPHTAQLRALCEALTPLLG